VWDLRYAPPKALHHEYPIAAIYKKTSRDPRGALVLPGEYTVTLAVGAETSSRPLTVIMDPRVKTPVTGLERQLKLSLRLTDMMREDYDALANVRGVAEQIATLVKGSAPAALKESLENVGKSVSALDGESDRQSEPRARGSGENLRSLNGELSQVFEIIQGSDNAPTTQAGAAIDDLQKSLQAQLIIWNELQAGSLTQINDQLRKAKLPVIQVRPLEQSRNEAFSSADKDSDSEP